MRPLRIVAIVLWVAVFLFAGIRLGQLWQPGTKPTVKNTVDTSVNLTVNTPAPATTGPGRPLQPIVLKDIHGQRRAVADWAGPTLLINFWATWCAPCREEMPLLEQFQASQDPARIQVLGIAIDRLEPVLRFLGETGVSYPNLVGEMDATRAAEQFGDAFVGLPFSVIVAPNGRVLALHTGAIGVADLEKIAAAATGLANGTLSMDAAQASLSLGKRPPS